jgi:hypothetical protein
MISTPQVDMEELKRQLRMKVLEGLRPILDASGIQFPNIYEAYTGRLRYTIP